MQTAWQKLEEVFPTRVGMNRKQAAQTGIIPGIPHTRGDEPQPVIGGQLFFQYSPHAWG